MNVVIVSGDFVRTGGMDRANLALASYLARQNPSDEIHLVAHRVDADLLTLPNVRFHRVAKPLGSYLLGGAGLNRTGRKIARQTKNARVIVNGGNCDCVENGPDVNWVHYVHAAWNPGSFDSLSIVQRVKSRWRRNRSLTDERAIVPRARVIIANSQRTKRDLIERLGVAEDRIRVIYYGTDPAIFYPASDDEKRAMRAKLNLPTDGPIAAFIGAAGDRRKGFDVLQRAWKIARLDADLIVIGAGEIYRDGNIHHLGFRSDVAQILRACDGLVSPARYEAYGLAIHEATCCGVPAIASKSAGVVERFPDALSPILLSDPNDADELVARLQTWQREIARWREIARALSDNWRKRSWDDMAIEIEQHLL